MNNNYNNMGNIDNTPIMAESNDVYSGNDYGNVNENGGFFSNIGVFKWMFIILLLAFLGVNVFVYMAKGTQGIVDLFTPLIKLIAKLTASATGQVVNVSAEGAKAIVGGTAAVASGTAGAAAAVIGETVGGTAKVINKGLSAVQDISTPSSLKGQDINKPSADVIQQSALNQTLDAYQQQSSNQDYQASEATSSIGGQQAGWCYIGADNGARTCGQVGSSDLCMSGDIFPTKEVCVNPNLRV